MAELSKGVLNTFEPEKPIWIAVSCRYRQYDIGNNCIRCQLFKGNENYSFLSIIEQRRPTYLPYVAEMYALRTMAGGVVEGKDTLY